MFESTACTFHNVFGIAAQYVVAATDKTVPLQFNLISLEKTDLHMGNSRGDSWILTGTILSADIAAPNKGDTITLDGDDRTYKLTQTPTTADDGLHWDVEFRHDEVTRRGGNQTLPIGL